jgi:putative redox protein
MSDNVKTAHATWAGQGVVFTVVGGSGFTLRTDNPPGPHAASPMELVAMASATCTASDVISILQKQRQHVTNFEVHVSAPRAGEHPKVFTDLSIEYVITGHAIDPQAVERAIELSLTKYCSVNLMLEQAVKITQHYRIVAATAVEA